MGPISTDRSALSTESKACSRCPPMLCAWLCRSTNPDVETLPGVDHTSAADHRGKLWHAFGLPRP